MEDKNDLKKKSSNIKIRPMEIDDLAQVFHLGENLFTAKKVPTLYRTWDEYEVLNLFQTDTDFCLVAEAEPDEKIVGFVLGATITKSHSAWKYGYLVWLGVNPLYQGQGIAEKLCNNFLDLMVKDGVRMLIVDTEADNKKAIHFFEKIGFGNPQKHVYLAMNLDPKRRKVKGKIEKQ